jgi:serine/threonine-protein kinase
LGIDIALGAGAGATALAVPLLSHAGTGVTEALVALGGGLVGSFGGFIYAREGQRRAASRAQTLRVHALERSLFLKETQDREVGGQLEGSVAAGQYRILQRMGSGATGVIYEAVRISDGMPVAIKLLRAAAAHEAVASDRLRREAEALGLAWHPNVVEVIDHGHLPDGTAYLVMELLHGESLATRLRNKVRLTPAELLPIAMQVCDALAAVHAAGVVHRDLKPSNIFLAQGGDTPAGAERVKLLDFGIARVEWEETRITNTGGPLGTPGYMSPEQETGSGDIDARSDLFAFGALLYECLVGEPPAPRSPSGLVRTGTGGEGAPNSSPAAPAAPPRVRALAAVRFDSGTQKSAALVPAVWRTIIEKAMALQPSQRYADAREMAQALRSAQQEIAQAEAST